MKNRFWIPILSVLASAAFGADPAAMPDSRQVMESSLARQRQAAAAMERSLAIQRDSVAKQTRQAAPGTFFLLDPPARSTTARAATPSGDCDPLPESVLGPLIEETARRQELEPELLRTVVRQESAFRPCAVSSKGAMGLMQLMPATAREMGVKDPFDARDNLEGGARFLKQLLETYQDLPLALSAYNAGPGNVDPAQGVPHIPETMKYVQKILSVLPFGW